MQVESMENYYDIIIVGGGPAGLTSAIYSKRAGKSVLVLEKEGFGGQISTSPRIDNYPGLLSVSGAEFSDRLFSQADALGTHTEMECVLKIENQNDLKLVVTDYGSYTSKAVILATGMKHRKLVLPGEDSMSGISFCAVCDGAFYRDKDVAVCGGGNTAVSDAIFLSAICRNVYLIHRRNKYRADDVLTDEIAKHKNIIPVLSSVITELTGGDSLSGLKIKNTLTGDISDLSVCGLFEAVGQLPEMELNSSAVKTDEAGFIAAGEDCYTSVPGIFAAGDGRQKQVRQLTTACGDGAVAAVAACEYCEKTT